jgi:beta-lactamase regulating signal transducer with metallopeptidase domain
VTGDWIAVLDRWSQLWAASALRACWQGSAALVLAWGAARALPRLSASARAWLWRLALLKLLVAFFWATPLDLPLLPPASPPAAQSARLAPASSAPAPAAQSSPGSHRAPCTTGFLFLLWLAGAAACGTGIAREWRAAARLRQAAAPLEDGWLAQRCRDLCWQLGLGGRSLPCLLVVDVPGGPALCGVIRPAVLLPAALLRTSCAGELRLVLGHELAHLARRDLLWNWLPALAHAAFFFHPLVWLANQEWRLAQEMACDELVMLRLAPPAADYGQALVRVAGWGSPRFQPALALFSGGESPQALKIRLAGLPRARHCPRARLAITAAAIGLAGIGGLLPWRLVPRARLWEMAVRDVPASELAPRAAAPRPARRALPAATEVAAPAPGSPGRESAAFPAPSPADPHRTRPAEPDLYAPQHVLPRPTGEPGPPPLLRQRVPPAPPLAAGGSARPLPGSSPYGGRPGMAGGPPAAAPPGAFPGAGPPLAYPGGLDPRGEPSSARAGNDQDQRGFSPPVAEMRRSPGRGRPGGYPGSARGWVGGYGGGFAVGGFGGGFAGGFAADGFQGGFAGCFPGGPAPEVWGYGAFQFGAFPPRP